MVGGALGPCYDHHRCLALARGSVPSAGSSSDFNVIPYIADLAYVVSPARLLLREARTIVDIISEHEYRNMPASFEIVPLSIK
jgi:hypothetical protein